MGGRARPLTSHVEMDDFPIWSPDGKRIAFASNRFGSWDTFITDVDGGRTRRLTMFSGAEIPSDWTNDGKEILVRTTRDAPENGMYAINAETGAFRLLFLDPMTIRSPKLSPDGSKVLYTRFGFPNIRPRYQGSAASQLWIYDLKSGRRSAVRNNGFQHLWPAWSESGMWAVTVTEKTPSTAPLGKSVGRVKMTLENTPNVYKVGSDGKVQRRTALVGDTFDSAHSLTVARRANVFAYEAAGDVYVGNDGKAQKVAITLNDDDRTGGENRQVLTSGAQAMTLSPDGTTVVFQAKNDLWRVPVKKGEGPNKDDAERLTDWPGFDEQPLFTPDGKAIFFVSDREGAERLYRMDLTTKESKAITREDADIDNLSLTPDKKSVAYWRKGAEGGLYVASVDGGPARRILTRKGARSIAYSFSPDGKWVAYADELPDSGFYYWERANNIFVVNVATGESHDVTQLSAQHFSPAWSPDGRFLYLGSDRNGMGLYTIALQREAVRGGDLPIKYTKPKTPVTVEIDFDRIEERVRRLTALPDLANLITDPEDGDIWRANANGEEAKRLTSTKGIQAFDMAPDGKTLTFLQGGNLQTLALRPPNTPVTTITFRGEWSTDSDLERKAAFNQLWREYNRGFYDPNFHGRNWAAI
ncbi:MAG: hypothetical protein C4320_10095, partial [Armatimonadota bacterium]